MKSLLVLLLGCLPLAILTAMSFVELRSIGGDPDAAGLAVAPAADTAAAETVQAQEKTELPVVEGLGQVDLFASETLPGLHDLPAGSRLDRLKKSWPGWVNVRQLVSRSANVEPAGAADGGDPPELAQRLEALMAEYEKSKPEGSEAVRLLLGRRIETHRRRTAQALAQRQADALLAQARTEFASHRFSSCSALCEQWLAKYADLDAQTAAKMRILCDRARFLDSYEQMRAQFRQADSLAKQQEIVEAFLNRYSNRTSPTAKEREILQQCQVALGKLRARLQAETTERQAAESLRGLTEKPPSGLAARLQAAAQLRGKYPNEAVSQAIRRQVGVWLAEVLADKAIEGPAGLLEVETRRGQILRGFFRKSFASDGSLIGYQHFTSYQQYRDPTAQVGTYAKEDLAAEPGASLARQCAGEYRQLRAELLSQPGRRANWEQLAGACEQFDARLAAYRQKPGAGAESLSFQAEARLAREILSAPAWGNMETIFAE